jgi:hypothetical protein
VKAKRVTRRRMRRALVGAEDMDQMAEHLARESLIDLADLCWLYERHRILAPASAWLLAAMWDGLLSDRFVEDKMADPAWWDWFDRNVAKVTATDR